MTIRTKKGAILGWRKLYRVKMTGKEKGEADLFAHAKMKAMKVIAIAAVYIVGSVGTISRNMFTQSINGNERVMNIRSSNC